MPEMQIQTPPLPTPSLAFVVQRCGSNIFGGAERYILELAKACAAQGAKVEIFASRSTSYLQWNNELPPNELIDADQTSTLLIRRFPVAVSRFRLCFALTRRVQKWLGVPLKVFGLETLWEHLFLFFQGPWCPALWKTLLRNEKNFDLIVCGGYLYAPTVKTLNTLTGKKRTLLITMAHNEPEFFLPFVRNEITKTDAIGFLSEAEKKLVEKTWPQARAKTSLILHPGLNNSQHNSDLEPTECPKIPSRFLLYVGRVDAHKGVNFLLENIPEHIPLVLAGDLAMVAEPHPNRMFLGRVSDATRDHLMKNTAALVIASRYESYSMVTADALAMGTPVLALQGCGPIDELIRHYGGISCDAPDFASWAERLFAGEPLPEELRPKPAKIKLERDWKASAQKLIAFAREQQKPAEI